MGIRISKKIGYYLPKKSFNKLLKPNIDINVYLFAKATGILKDNISYYDFKLLVNPSIITNWS